MKIIPHFLLINFVLLQSALFCLKAQTLLPSDFEPCVGKGNGAGPVNYRLLTAWSVDGILWNKTAMVLSDQASVSDALVLDNGRIIIYYVTVCAQKNNSPISMNNIVMAVSDNHAKSWSYHEVEFTGQFAYYNDPVDPNVVLLLNGDINMLATIDSGNTQIPQSYTCKSLDSGFSFNIEGKAFSVPAQALLDPENFRFSSAKWKIWTGGIPGQNIMGESSNDTPYFTNADTFCASKIQSGTECYVTADITEMSASNFKMWAFCNAPQENAIVSLSSTDGDNWTLDSGDRLLINPSSTYEYKNVWAPTVIKMPNDTFLMIYETEIPSSYSSSPLAITIEASDNTILNIGDTLFFYAKGIYSDSTQRDFTTFSTWSSTNNNIAGIDSLGKLLALSTGSVFVYATKDNLISDSIMVTIGNNSIIDELYSKSDAIKIFPNPSGGIINILHLPDKKISHVLLKNIYGRQIISIPFANTINVSNLPQGIYIISFDGEMDFANQCLTIMK